MPKNDMTSPAQSHEVRRVELFGRVKAHRDHMVGFKVGNTHARFARWALNKLGCPDCTPLPGPRPHVQDVARTEPVRQPIKYHPVKRVYKFRPHDYVLSGGRVAGWLAICLAPGWYLGTYGQFRHLLPQHTPYPNSFSRDRGFAGIVSSVPCRAIIAQAGRNTACTLSIFQRMQRPTRHHGPAC